jgi:hypothetical protein
MADLVQGIMVLSNIFRHEISDVGYGVITLNLCNTVSTLSVCNCLCAGSGGLAVWGVGLDRLYDDSVGSNPAQGMDVCPRLSVLCCPVQVEAFATGWSLVQRSRTKCLK